MVDPREADRIHWACRRGLLELDLLLQKFVNHRFHSLDAAQVETFKELLAYADNDLLDMVMGRADPVDERVSAVLEMMRNA